MPTVFFCAALWSRGHYPRPFLSGGSLEEIVLSPYCSRLIGDDAKASETEHTLTGGRWGGLPYSGRYKLTKSVEVRIRGYRLGYSLSDGLDEAGTGSNR